MKPNKPRWLPLNLSLIIKRKVEGASLSEFEFNIYSQWLKLPYKQKSNEVPYYNPRYGIVMFKMPKNNYREKRIDASLF